jgi:hypothetical protein
MKTKFLYPFLVVVISNLFVPGCGNKPDIVKVDYQYTEPTYANIQLIPQPDTLSFHLAENSYNMIGSFNYFTDHGKPFISFFDRDGRSIITYNFLTQQLVHKIPLKKWFADQSFKKASTYVVNFDSIFVITAEKLIIVDSSSKIKKTVALFDDPDKKPFNDNETPAVIKSHILYTGMMPIIAQGSLKSHREFKVLCGFDLNSDTKGLYYQLPEIYQENLYGYSYLEYSYCVNDQGNFVFSFPADTTIYETNLSDYNKSYFAKSHFQTENIKPISREVIESGGSRKEYYTSYSYGTVYYDPYQKRYMRLARQKINEADYLAKNKIRKRSMIFFDDHFKIIGESLFDDNFDYRSIFFTPQGTYTRVRLGDEQALHFVQMKYSDLANIPTQISQNTK